MAEKKIGKSKFVVYSSSSEQTVSETLGSLHAEDLDQENILMHPAMYKPIQRLKSCPNFKDVSRKTIVESLMKQPNPDAGKDIVVDVGSDTEEIELTYSEIINRHPPPKKIIYTLPRDEYQPDKEDKSPKTRLYSHRGLGSVYPNEIKNLIGYKYSQFTVGMFKIKVPSGWSMKLPEEDDRVCLYRDNNFAIYPECFWYGMRLPFNEFQKEVFNFFRVAPSMLTPNSWRILVCFEAICVQIIRRPTARSFHFFFQLKSRAHWFYFSKRPGHADLKLMGGLAESAHDWKEYFWVIKVDPLEAKLDFHHAWCRPIHCKGEPKEEDLGPQDRSTVNQISGFVKRYLDRYEPPLQEFDAKEIVRRYQDDLPVFEIPAEMIGDGTSRDELEQGVLL